MQVCLCRWTHVKQTCRTVSVRTDPQSPFDWSKPGKRHSLKSAFINNSNLTKTIETKSSNWTLLIRIQDQELLILDHLYLCVTMVTTPRWKDISSDLRGAAVNQSAIDYSLMSPNWTVGPEPTGKTCFQAADSGLGSVHSFIQNRMRTDPVRLPAWNSKPPPSPCRSSEPEAQFDPGFP